MSDTTTSAYEETEVFDEDTEEEKSGLISLLHSIIPDTFSTEILDDEAHVEGTTQNRPEMLQLRQTKGSNSAEGGVGQI